MGTAIHVHPMVREVTEDTPPDLLEGTMDLLVTLPSKKSVRMTVNRRTPMMDLLIQVTTANKINPAGHIVQVKNERGIELPYKPSTPIGILDTTTIDIVPKNQVSEYIIVKKQAKHVNPLFEKTFRLQVHLPRNQLYVMRVGPRTVLQDILEEVCLEKNLDIEKYEIRHPVNLDEKLDLGNRLGDYGLQELTIVSRNSRINSSVSTADIMALQQMEDGRVKGRMDSAFKYSRSSVGDSSVSSESATSGRGISPSRSASDDSRSISPLLPINHPKLLDKAGTTRSNRIVTQSMSMDIPGKPKKRAAPAPPPTTPTSTTTTTMTATREDRHESPSKPISKKKEPPREPPILRKQQSLPSTSHSRHSSDSSGYHESSNASILSEHPELHQTERSIPSGVTAMEPLSSLSKKPTSSSGTNLTSVSSLSSSSLTSSNGGMSSRNKRKAPKPPGSSLQAQAELEEEISLQSEASSSSKVNEWNRNSSHQEQQVKVDVHDDLTKEIQSLDSEDEEKKSYHGPPSGRVTKSSSSASSLSGRASASGSSSRSSPLPAVDRDGGLEPSSRNATLTNDGDLPMANPNHLSETSIVAQETFSAAASAPLPQPRTKPRTAARAAAAVAAPTPIPMARRRPDRELPIKPVPEHESQSISCQNVSPPVVTPTTEIETEVPPPRRIRNVVGVKVFPDNALEAHAARLEKSKSHENSRPLPMPTPKPTPAAAPTRLENESKPDVVVDDSNNTILMPQNLPPPPGLEDELDSDNLEENLELFEGRIASDEASEFSSASSFEDILIQEKTKHSKSISSDSGPVRRRKSKYDGSDEDDDSSAATISETTTPTKKSTGLNRWENEESLHSIERERLNSNPSNMTKRQNKAYRKRDTEKSNTGVFKSSSPPPLIKKKPSIPRSGTTMTTLTSSSNPQIPVHDTMEGAGEEATSSESEASYADSGIPATANVTPSPISLEQDQDIDRSDKDVRSNGSSRRSSIHSNHSGSWRQILQSKVENPRKNKEEMSLDSDKEDKKLTDAKTKSNFKLIPRESESTSQSPDSPILIEPNTLKDEVEGVSSASDEEIKVVLNGAEDSPPPSTSPTRKLSKSESFTHNSEFDVAKMKRKLFSTSGSNNRTSGGITGQMKGNLSSSDEDVRGDDSSNLRFTSMQNLSNPSDAKSRRRGNSARAEEKVFRKATSVVGLETLAPDIAAENPELRQTFQLELEAQFEQWKEQFLQRHLGGSKSGSIDSASNDEQVQKSTPVTTTGTGADKKTSDEKENLIIQSNENSLTSSSHSRGKQEEEFDPEKPQIVHSVSKNRDLKLGAGVQSEKLTPRSVKQEEENYISFQPQVESTESSQLSTETGTGEPDNEMNGASEPVVQKRQPRANLEDGSHVYRYSGPPAIQMGTWGERPRGAISVKKDTDYIMGMGQNDAGKAGKLGAELRSPSTTKPNSIASRAQTFNGTSSLPTPSLKTTTTAPIQSKWSVVGNAAAAEPTSKNSGSIVSSWKQRMQETELERKQKKEEVKDEPQPPSKLPEVKIQTKSASATNTLEKPKPKANFQITSASNTLDRPAFRKTVNADYVPLAISQAAKNYNEPNLTIESKPSASVSTNGLRPTQSFQTIGKDVAKMNGSFKTNLTEGATLDEKKKFFQGVKPAESPTKEVPLPAVNMKTNIATIQRVFEQRQPQNGTSNSSTSTRASSPALSTSSSSTSLSNSNSSKLPDLIGQNSSSLMLQRVMKTQSFNMDNFRRTPSPQTSSPERYTPSPTPAAVHTVVDGPVRISTKTNTITNSNGSIQNMGNKAIIIVNGDNNPPTNSISSNFFKQQVKVTAAKPIENTNTRSQNNGVKININGLGNNSTSSDKAKTVILHTTPEPETKREMVIVHKNESNNNNANPPPTKPNLKASESFKQPVNKINLVQKTQTESGKSAGAPPPPPPPPADLSISKNLSPTTNGGMGNGKVVTPTSPMSSDPRAEIFNAISGGNFKLKKTGSTVLLN